MEEIINMTRVFIEKEESKEGLYCDTVNGDLNFENEETGSSNEEMKCDTPELERKSFLQKVGDCFSGNCFTAFSNEVPAEKTAELIMDQPEEKESPSTIKYVRFNI